LPTLAPLSDITTNQSSENLVQGSPFFVQPSNNYSPMPTIRTGGS
jgi:hypothetical protein